MYFNDHVPRGYSSLFMSRVYGWMSCALLITAGIAYYTSINSSLFMFIQQPAVLIGLCIMQLFFVIGIVTMINRLSFGTALVLFLLYACSLGITLSSVFYVYTYGSIVSTFLTTALTFGAMSFYGYTTKSDLTTIGSMAFMVLIGVVIAMLINMFLQSAQLDYLLSIAGVIIFVLLTAYDTQKIKNFGNAVMMNEEIMNKMSLIGALTLYLDFINLFLFLLRFLGKRNEK